MKLIVSVLSLRLTLKYMSLAKKMAVALNLSIKLLSFIIFFRVLEGSYSRYYRYWLPENTMVVA